MNCRQVEAKLADWSADNLPETFCAELREHLRQCPPCAECWAEFEKTLKVVSNAPQPVLTREQSLAMWRCCEEHMQQKAAQERSGRVAQYESKRAWWNIAPRWGWTAFAGACAVLAAAYFAPISSPQNSDVTPDKTRIAKVPRDEWIRFSVPPAQAASFINHHTTMAFDPFSDHTTSTLISDAATNNSPDETVVIPVADVSTQTAPSTNP